MNLKTAILLLLSMSGFMAALAQEQEVKFVQDNSLTVGQEEAKVILKSNSDALTVTDKTTGRVAVKETASDGSYHYILNLFYDGVEEDGFVRSNIEIQSPDGQRTVQVVAYVGKVMVATYNEETMIVEKDNVRGVYPEEKKAKITFLSPLTDLTIVCNGTTLFKNGTAQTVSGTNVQPAVVPGESLTEYVLVFSLDEARKPAVFLKNNLAFTFTSKIGRTQTMHDVLGMKEAHQYVVKSKVKIVEVEVTYNELLAKAKEYSAAYATQHESAWFLAGNDAYEAVRTHMDCPVNLKDSYQKEQNKFIFLRKYSRYVEQADERWRKAEAAEGFESENVWKYLNLGRQMCQEIVTKYPEMTWFKQKLAEFDALYKKHPQSNVELPIVTGKVSKSDGWFLPVDGTAIYAVNFNCGGLDEIKGHKPVGAVQNGAYKVVLREPCKYLYFAGEKRSRPIEHKTQTLDMVLTR